MCCAHAPAIAQARQRSSGATQASCDCAPRATSSPAAIPRSRPGGLVGLYKAIRDYRVDKDTTFRSFAELCITRQIITAIKTATRHKHRRSTGALSFSHTPAGYDDGSDFTLGDALPGSPIDDPARRVVATEELAALVGCLGSSLSPLEGRVLTLYLEGRSYEEIGELVDCDPKAVDNALQRVKRKVGQHLATRAVLDA